ncbi:hypothetical protein MRB53_008818 [Persea americana]|uniref:Uncharacterized protein n=1 Tax=Persea americana TaxID=3435 RepID=A0ACC2LNE8_PERAE|nr:hypothetical protein MRB53_008818 [Persea americana]
MDSSSPRKGRGKRKTTLPHQPHHLFAQLLAASSNIHTPFSQSLLPKLLKTHLSNIQNTPSPQQKNPQFFPKSTLQDSLLSLLPCLLQPKYPKIAACSAEIVGALALCSFELNARIAFDEEIMCALVNAVASGKKRVVMGACNAMLDLSTTLIGRERLREFSAVEKLLSVFCQIAAFPMKPVSHCGREEGTSNYSRIGFVEDNLQFLVLEAVSTLINTCSAEFLEKLSGTFLCYLKDLWAKLQDSVFQINNQEKRYLYNNMTTSDLAETIFRLSMNYGCHSTCTSDAVKRSIFGSMESDFEHFMLSNWEDSPILFKTKSRSPDDNDSIFSSLVQHFKSRTIDSILDSILGGLFSCPPIASDELDILTFLKEVKGGLACPIVYGQDIRVVKTVGILKEEVHFWTDYMGYSIGKDHVQKCKGAYQNGYTIALRGMEFRSRKIAAIADGLEMLFGQPSVGANLYLTPPRSQGLTRHYDDHCVFVCQLLGSKKWSVFPHSGVQLPRLYDPLGVGSEGTNDACEKKQFLLREGDILYIPRGCPHEADTVINEGESHVEEATGFSLHLTLGIEIEPPFEWEGFAHIALHCWNENRKETTHDPIESTLQLANVTFINLLHVAIRVVGDNDPTFRRACMVAAFSLPFDSNCQAKQSLHPLDMDQRATFSYIIDKINAGSCFLEAFEIVEAAVHGRNDDSLQWMRWLRHLPREGAADESIDYNNPWKVFENLVLLYNGRTEEAHAAFAHIKSQFCEGVIFEDVCNVFDTLLKKYRRTRKQYMNGMLSLRCNY